MMLCRANVVISHTTVLIATMLEVGQAFATIKEAKEAINRHVIDDGESYKVYKSDSKRHILQCKSKDENCSFSIRAALSAKKGITITKMSPHSCRPTVHYKNKQLSALWFLKEHHRASVIENRNIIPKQLQADERLRFSNVISYRQAYRLVSASLP
jgi:hypothetical protein